MTKQRQTLREQYEHMPSVMRWAGIATLAILLYLFYDGVIAPQAAAWNEQADAIVAEVARVHEGEGIVKEFGNPARMRPLVLNFGPVEMPEAGDASAPALSALVNEILARLSPSNDSFDLRLGAALPKSSLPTISRGGRIDRMVGDLKFDARPDVAIAIITELESRPEVESINSVQMTKAGNGQVKVRLSIEAWVRRNAA